MEHQLLSFTIIFTMQFSAFNPFSVTKDWEYLYSRHQIQEVVNYAETRFVVVFRILCRDRSKKKDDQSLWMQKLLHRELVGI
jgi:hypothetical protein